LEFSLNCKHARIVRYQRPFIHRTFIIYRIFKNFDQANRDVFYLFLHFFPSR